MFDRCKKGEAAAGAAVLLAIIAGLLVVFVVMMPPAEREELLGDSSSDTHNTSTDLEEAVIQKTLLDENPGRIDYISQEEYEHSIPAVNVFTRMESKVIAEKSSVFMKKSLFSEETGTFTFSLGDLQNTGNVLLSLKVLEISGRLIITLNGEQIFNSEIIDNHVPAMSLPQSLLKEKNELIFAVSSPGGAFWATNKATLERLQIVGDINNLEAKSAKGVFIVSEVEKNNVEKMVLRFKSDCDNSQQSPLQVNINGAEVYNSIPDCDLGLVKIELSPGQILSGENEVRFQTDDGAYYLSNILVSSQLQEIQYPTYYFELSLEEEKAVSEGKRRLRLEMDFVDVTGRKNGDLEFNGHLESFDTKETSFTADLSNYVEKSNNALKIKPKRTLEIRRLKIDLVK